MFTFTSIVVIVFGILQIILFFKVWIMTNDVQAIKKRISSNEYTIKEYIIMDDKDTAFKAIKEELVKRLNEIYPYYSKKENFVKRIDFVDEYVGYAKEIGRELPEHLKSAEAFWDYCMKLCYKGE